MKGIRTYFGNGDTLFAIADVCLPLFQRAAV